VSQVTFDRAHLVAVAACPVDGEQVASENIERVRRYREDDVAAQLELRDWLIRLGSVHGPGRMSSS